MGTRYRPGSLLVQGGHIAVVGKPADIPTDLVGEVQVVDRTGDLLLPQMVSAHTHLELTDIGPLPFDPAGGFVGWVKQVRQTAPLEDTSRRLAVEAGCGMALEAGVFAVGDIASSPEMAKRRHEQGLLGTTFVELFGLGQPFDQCALDLIEQTDPMQFLQQSEHEMGSRIGWQPHAPYSAGPSLFAAAARSGSPISTHLAETRDEADFVGALAGPLMEYIKQLGRWDDRFAEHYGQGLSPVQWIRPHLEANMDQVDRLFSSHKLLVAHCNYVDEDDILLLSETKTSVAYCPIASEYFGHENHRYREMLDAGINVCLGTDSIVGADPTDLQPLGLLSAMRRLIERDQTDPDTLLAMATTNGARALGLGNDPRIATLQPGAPARFACIPIDPESDVDPLIQVLSGQDPVQAISFEE